MKEKIKKYIFYFFVFAIFGWCWEIIVNIVLKHGLINPGTLRGPWLPIYGWGIIITLLLSKKIDNKYLLFIALFLVCGIVEYSTSLYLEFFYHKRWWNYSRYPLNINGRVCVEALLIFATIAMLSLRYAVPFLDKLYKKINPKVMTIVLSIVASIFIVDYIISTIEPNRIKRKVGNINVEYNLKEHI